jgi:hypothetical protein
MAQVAAPTPPVEVTPAATPAPTAPTAPRLVEIALRSDPPGADVYDGARHLGATPLKVKHTPGGEAMQLSFHRSGYHEMKKSVVPDRDLDIEVLLVARQKNVASRPARASTTTSHRTQQATSSSSKRPASDLRNPFD